MALAGTRQLRSQGSVLVYTRDTEGVTRPEIREGTHGDRNGGEGGNGNGVRDGNGTGPGKEIGSEMGKEVIMERGWGAIGELSYPLHQERSRVEDQALPFHTWHHLCREEAALAGSQQLREQDPIAA